MASTKANSRTVWLKQWVNEGVPSEDDFEVRDTEVDWSELPDDAIVVQARVMSVDPYLRGRGHIRDPGTGGKGEKVMSGFIGL